MMMSIAKALAEFQMYLAKNMGSPITIETIRAFAEMVQKISAAIMEGDE